MFGSHPIGGRKLPSQPRRLYRAEVGGAIAGGCTAGGAELVDFDLSDPAADVELEPTEVAVLDGAPWVVDVHRI